MLAHRLSAALPADRPSFAVLEGEIYYSKVCADAMVGKLNWLGVWCAGALGGSTGDQIWFYLLRGRIHWLDRYPEAGEVSRPRSARACRRTRR